MSEKKESLKLTLTKESFVEAVKVAFNTGMEYSQDLIKNGKSEEVSNKFSTQFVDNLLNKHKEKSAKEEKES